MVGTTLINTSIHNAHGRFRHWLFDRALPFWATAGLDGPGLGFHEHLSLLGEPTEVPYKRTRVQARQIYGFSHAALLGWADGIAIAQQGYDFLVAHAARNNGAFARTLGRDGSMLDATVDLYDQAFILLALAWYARATGLLEPLSRARRLVDWLDQHAKAEVGYHNSWPMEPGHRQQNPHMHLLEAMLALYETSGEVFYLDHATDLVALLRLHFFDKATGTLGEFFDHSLKPAIGEAGDHIEPGHHYEWVWLLDQYARLTGDNAEDEVAALYAFAEGHGKHPQRNAIVDVLDRAGRIRQASSRLWPHAEAIKAHVAMTRKGRPAGPRIVAGVEALLDRHFVGCPPGTWREHFDSRGTPTFDRIPASSFYHIVMAFGELDRFVQTDLDVP